jgi:hypothetical protein
VAKVDAGSQPTSFQVLGVLLGELDRPSVILEVPLGGWLDLPIGQALGHVNDDDRIASALAILAASSTAFSAGLDPSTATRMVSNIAGSPPWVAWLAAVSIAGRRPSRLADLLSEVGPADQARRTPSQLAPSRSNERDRLAGST